MTSDPVARAIAALRGGRPVRIGQLTLLSVETASDAMLDLLDAQQSAPILISGQRAAALGLANQRDAAEPLQPVQLVRADWLQRNVVRQLADAGRDLDRFLPGPLLAKTPDDAEGAQAAMTLARLAGLLPAFWLVAAEAAAQLSAAEIGAAVAGERAAIVARARLPIADIGEAQILAIRDAATGEEHVALIIGAFAGRPPLVRLHSECLTGDVFGSLKCDCGPQLHEALRLLQAAGGGVLLYLRQEGRGIGLANKLRAYALQDRGLDTVDANQRLGFADDSRDYRLAATILRAIGVDTVRLLTNNPGKVAGLENAGISVVERVAHHMPANPHNADYLATKRARSGHLA